MVEQFESRNPVEILAEEFLDRKRLGELTSVSEYAITYPELADEIRQLFPMMMALEQVKTTRFSSSGRALELQIDAPPQLGDFRIIREIARGGMGVVYEAEQVSLGRRVAVKVIPPQLLSDPRQLRRFHREARTAASLHHTNIVPVFGVGEQDGLHYYVMQKIDGAALDRLIADTDNQPAMSNSALTVTLQRTHIEDNILRNQSHENAPLPATDVTQHSTIAKTSTTDSPRSRDSAEWRLVADIGIQVAEALVYAHEQGVLHQDIKPGNLLLDPHGTVWVTDFGLATALSEEKLHGEGVGGTLRFMAPEHLTGKPDTHSDIYSLGVTLYELITRTPAFVTDSRKQTVQRILNADFVPPRKVCPEIPRDLEAIVLKAMALNPEDRYATAKLLAVDLRSFVAGLPVLARPLSAPERAWRWMRRNPLVASLSAALLIMAAALFMLIGSEWQTAVAESRRAEGNLSLALESMEQILERFTSGWMAHPRNDVSLDGQPLSSDAGVSVEVSNYSAAVLEDALRFYDRFTEQNASNPELKLATARVHRRVGEIYERLGQHKQAELAFRRSLRLLDSNIDLETSVEVLERARTLNELGQTLHSVSQFPAAASEFQQAKQILSQTRFLQNPACQAETARTEINLGRTLWLMGERDEAGRCHRGAIELLERLVSFSSQAVQHRLLLAFAYRSYARHPSGGDSGRNSGQLRAAGVEIMEDLVRQFPAVPDYQCELAEMLTMWPGRSRGSATGNQHAADVQRAVDLTRQLVTSYPTIPRYRAALASAINVLAGYVQRDSSSEAELLFAESEDLYRELVEDFRDTPVYRMLHASALRDYSNYCRRSGDLFAAAELLEKAIAVQTSFVEQRPNSVLGAGILRRLEADLARLVLAGKDAEPDQKTP